MVFRIGADQSIGEQGSTQQVMQWRGILFVTVGVVLLGSCASVVVDLELTRVTPVYRARLEAGYGALSVWAAKRSIHLQSVRSSTVMSGLLADSFANTWGVASASDVCKTRE